MSIIGGKYSSLGIEISDRNLRLVQLKRKGRKAKIQALNQKRLPPGIVENGEINNKEKTKQYLQTLCQNPFFGKIKSDKAVTSLPDSRSFIKLVTVEKSLNDLSEAVETEIEKNIPFRLHKVYFDWQIIEEYQDSYSILFGACPKVISDIHYDVLASLGFKVEGVEAGAVAMTRSLLKEDPFIKERKDHNTYLIIYLGESKTTFVIYSRNSILFTMDIDAADKDVTEKISDELGVTNKEAEKKKKEYSKGSSKKMNTKVGRIIKDHFSRINEKKNEILDFFNYKYEDRDPLDKILLCGSGANYTKIDSFLASDDIGTIKGDTLINLSHDKENFVKEVYNQKNPKNFSDPTLSLATPIGLALGDLSEKN